MAIEKKPGGGGHIQQPYDTKDGEYVESGTKKETLAPSKSGRESKLAKKFKKTKTDGTTTLDEKVSSEITQKFIKEREKRKVFSNIYSLKNFIKHRAEKFKEMWVRGRIPSYQKEKIEARCKELAPKIKEMINQGQYTMKVNFRTLIDNIFPDNKFKNQIEVGKSRGAKDPDRRIQISNRMFGTDVSKHEFGNPSTYKNFYDLEKYGYLSEGSTIKEIADDLSGKWYGNCEVIFDKDKLKNRTTYCLGDSLDHRCYPKTIDEDFDYYSMGEPFRKNILDDYSYNELMGSKNLSELKANLFQYPKLYMELQYHGELTPDDMKGLVVPTENISLNPSTTEYQDTLFLLNKAKKIGFKIYVKDLISQGWDKSNYKIKELKMLDSGKITLEDVKEGEKIE